MNSIKQTIQNSFKSKTSKIVFIIVFSLSLFAYYQAIALSIKFEDFIRFNPFHIVVLQIILSLINAFLIAISIMLFSEAIRKKKKAEELNIFQALVSLFFSLISTGCYICGSVLPAALGIAAPFATLPLGGLEIKFLTIPMLMYSIRQFSRQLNDQCEIKNYRKYNLKYSNWKFEFSLKKVDRLRPLFMSIFFIVLIYSLPLFIGTHKKENKYPQICSHSMNSKVR